MMVLLKAVGALDHQISKNDLSVCTHYGLRPKAMVEIQKIRRQLTQIGKFFSPVFMILTFAPTFSSSFSNIHTNNKHVVYDIYIDPIGRKKPCLCCFFFSLTKQRLRLDGKKLHLIFFSVKSILPETTSVLDARILPPNEQQLCLLRKILAAGMVDRLAKYVPILQRGKGKICFL